jgi:hypothetical protein
MRLLFFGFDAATRKSTTTTTSGLADFPDLGVVVAVLFAILAPKQKSVEIRQSIGHRAVPCRRRRAPSRLPCRRATPANASVNLIVKPPFDNPDLRRLRGKAIEYMPLKNHKIMPVI